MAEQASRASEQEITDTLLYIHEEAANVVPVDERLYGGSAYSETKNLWSMDVQKNCRLTVLERHLRIRKSLDSPLEDPLGMITPLHLDLPEGRHGDFTLGMNREGCYFLADNSRTYGPEALSYRGLLGILGVKDTQELWLAIKQRTEEEEVRKETTREITLYSQDLPECKLYTYDKSVNGFVTSIFSSLDCKGSADEKVHLEGTVDLAWADGRRVLDGYTFSDSMTGGECTLSRAKLLDLGSTVLSILDEYSNSP